MITLNSIIKQNDLKSNASARSVGGIFPVLLVLLELFVDFLGLPLHPDHGSLQSVVLLVVNVEHTVLLMRDVVDAQCELEVDHR